MKVGYARVSSSGQSLDVQVDTLKNSGCEKIFQEKVSGTSTQGRDKLRECLDFVREGDEVVFTRVDRVARSVLDLQLIVKELNQKGVILNATEQPISTKALQQQMSQYLGYKVTLAGLNIVMLSLPLMAHYQSAVA